MENASHLSKKRRKVGDFFDHQSILTIKRLFEDIPIPMILVGKDENIIFLNKAFASYLHVLDSEYIGKNILTLISNSDIPNVMKNKKALFGHTHTFINGVIAGQKAITHCIPVLDDGEAVACFGIVIFQNIDEFMTLSAQINSLQRELHYYKNEIKSLQSTKYSIDSIRGNSLAVEELKATIHKLAFASRKSTILIHGESGSGKELVAQSIHSLSASAHAPFIRLNCAAIPENLCESEFFGYADGAFTGAKKGGAIGKFESANRGTLFLDEIGELPLFMQAKILRVLQEREITRIGGSKAIPVDVRVIAATNRDLEAMVKEGKFREDLYYRLNILSIRVPPLRERMEDLEVLVGCFSAELSKDYGVQKLIDPEVIKVLEGYSWPGNIRELSNEIEKMYFAADGNVITLKDISPGIFLKLKEPYCGESEVYNLDSIIDKVEIKTVIAAMERCGNNVSRAAKLLGSNRPRIYRILERIKQNTE